MKASVIRSFGGPQVFEYCEVDTPQPRPNEVLIKVHACGINHFDIFCRRGQANPNLRMPHVMGADIVGQVVEVGRDVADLEVGERVIVAPGYPVEPKEYRFEPVNLARTYSVTGGSCWGGYAEYMVAPACFVLRQPPDLPSEELASIPLVLVTAVHAVKTLGQVSSGHKILVQAGASGSGAMCIQVAKALGAEVATTVGSDAKIDFATRMGADVVVNYERGDFTERIRQWSSQGVDAVIDNVGGSVFAGNVKSLKRGGRLVIFGMVGGRTAEFVFPLMFYKQLHVHGSMMGTTAELDWGLQQVHRGVIKPLVDRTMPLNEAARAHEYIEARQVKGKVVLLPGG